MKVGASGACGQGLEGGDGDKSPLAAITSCGRQFEHGSWPRTRPLPAPESAPDFNKILNDSNKLNRFCCALTFQS